VSGQEDVRDVVFGMLRTCVVCGRIPFPGDETLRVYDDGETVADAHPACMSLRTSRSRWRTLVFRVIVKLPVNAARRP
jgi:hypothetical protein